MEEQQSHQLPSKNLSVLCIEDERFISDLYKRALTRAGYTVQIAAEGEEGFKLAQEKNYDVILLDIMLPNVNGVDMLYKLKDPENPTKSKVIITTNLDQKEEVRAQVEKLADGYLIKAEITPKELVKFVDQVTGA